MAGNANSGSTGRRAARETDRAKATLGELCDAVVRKAVNDPSLTLKERADLAIRITVKRMPTVIDAGGSFNEFMANLLTKGDKIGSK